MLNAQRTGMDVEGKQNVVVVVSDTLRTAFLGCYGNTWIHTPNIDKFAAEGTVFENAHPESLPTIPMRRAVHSGRRAYPFADYKPVSWDNVYLPGWQPMDSDEPTVAETLAAAGYHTGFYADVPHYFVPGMNFTRGFLQWEYVRGQSEDRYRSSVRADRELLQRYGASGAGRAPFHLVNVRPSGPEEEWPTARTFRHAIQFLRENRDNTPFYLYVDTFTPHETWEAPLHYYDLYGKREEREPIPINMPYGPLAKNPELESLLPSLRANYAGLVTMVDHWFGELLNTMDILGMKENTIVVFTSDHGTNFADNAERVTGKPASHLYPGTMDVPLLIRMPSGAGAGSRRTELVYTLDIPATVAETAGIRDRLKPDGQDLIPLLTGANGWKERSYLTCRYGNYVWYKDSRSYFYSDVEFSEPRLFDRETDRECSANIAAESPERVALAKEAILSDAGGSLMKYVSKGMTDALGRPMFDVKAV